MGRVELSRVKDQDLPRVVVSKVLPIINQVLQTGHYIKLNPDRLINKLTATGCSIKELQEREKKENPIDRLFPYYKDLLLLGVKSITIEQAFNRVSDSVPYIRKSFESPEQIDVSKNFFIGFDNPVIGITHLLISLDILRAPEIRKINDPELKESARKIVEKNVVEGTLRKIIQNSSENFEDPKFDDVKARIRQDLASPKTTFYLFGALIGTTFDDQSLDESSLSSDSALHREIAHLLAFPALKLVLANLGINPLQVNSILSDTKRHIKIEAEHIKKGTEIDLSDEAQGEDWAISYRRLLDLYLNSQIPYLTMMDNVDIE